MKILATILLVSSSFYGVSQSNRSLKKIKPTAEFENIHVLKLAEDELQSTFVIWVKDSVPEHHHAHHSENIVVISGKAVMTLGDETFTISAGDYINIPEGTKHSVKEIKSHGPLKVLSVQAPLFDGSDRVNTQRKPKDS